MNIKRILSAILFLSCPLVAIAEPRSIQGALEWPEPQVENRPGCYWWWMGSAVDEANLTWNLETLDAAGMGGVTIVPIYGVKGYQDRFIQHRSPKFMERVSYTMREAERLSMWVDMTTGTGWPFGGPMVDTSWADTRAEYRDEQLRETFSGRNVKRPAPGGAGKTIDPYSAEAMARYLAHYDEPFGAEGVVLPRAMYHDSFEFRGNWSRNMPEAFKELRRYDLMEHLPELFGRGDPEAVLRIKADYQKTLSDLHLEYLETWVEWSKAKGMTTRNQAHGAPGNLLDFYAAAGIPETETFGASKFEIPGIRREADNVGRDYPVPLVNRMASSAAHVAGKPLVASETNTWIRNHFRAALSQAKPEIDQLFLNGINHIFFHGTTYSPQDAAWPGWLFYASFQYNPRNSIWRDAPLLNSYITRSQSILQSGEPDNDVALYWPVQDIWHNPKIEGGRLKQQLTVHTTDWMVESSAGKTAQQLIDEGFGFDFISDRQLIAGLGQPYKAIVVPQTQHMPLATLEHLLAASSAGQPIIFLDQLPADVPGYHDFEKRRVRLQTLLDANEPRIVKSSDLSTVLGQTEVVREPMVEHGLDFTRRTHESGYHYFVANMGAESVDGWVTLGVPFRSVVIMDPQTGASGVAHHQGAAVYLQLKPGESRILRSFDQQDVEGDKWPIYQRAGDPLIVSGEWTVEFIEGGPVLPEATTMLTLKSWTETEDPEADRFAGTARYSTELDLPDEVSIWEIDLGEVRESARVFVNGHEVAGLYSVPFSAVIGEHFKPGRNHLAIEVTNLSANRIRDLDRRAVDWKIFHEINFVDHLYKKFDASDWALTPSGLLGPVKLIPIREIRDTIVPVVDAGADQS